MTPFAEGIEALQPGATGRDMVDLLDGRAKRTTALEWKSGRHRAPRWALQLLASKIRQRANQQAAIAARLDATPERPGYAAGAKNLAAYLARR